MTEPWVLGNAIDAVIKEYKTKATMIKTKKQYKEAMKQITKHYGKKCLSDRQYNYVIQLIKKVVAYESKHYNFKKLIEQQEEKELRGIRKKDITPHTMEKIKTEFYGKRGTKKRDEAEKKIKKLSKTVVEMSEEKAFCEELENHMERIRIRKASNIK